MTGLAVTRHGEARMSRRDIRKSDLDILRAYGEEDGRNRIVLTKREAAKAVRALKKRTASIERLTGKVLVVVNGQLVTVYRQSAPIRPPRRRKTARWLAKTGACVE